MFALAFRELPEEKQVQIAAIVATFPVDDTEEWAIYLSEKQENIEKLEALLAA